MGSRSSATWREGNAYDLVGDTLTMIDMPLIPLSRLPTPQRITHGDYIKLMDGAPTRDIVNHGVTHAITPDGAVIKVSDEEPPEWIGNLPKSEGGRRAK